MASLQNNFFDFWGLFAQPQIGVDGDGEKVAKYLRCAQARSVGDCKESTGRAWVGKANLDTEEELPRQIDWAQQL